MMDCGYMLAGIFDRLFKKKPQAEELEYEDDSEFEYAPGEGMVFEEEQFPGPHFHNIPSDIEMDSSINYNFKGPEYRLKIHNKSIDMLGNITVHLRSEKKTVASVIDTKRVVEMLEPGKSLNMKFKLKPNYKIGKSGIYGKVEYFDFKSKENKILRLPQANIDFELKDLASKRITEDEWRQICSGLNSYEIETRRLEIEPDKVFKIFKNTLNNMGLYMLPPIENVNLYRGIARFYSYDEDSNNFTIETQVIGDKKTSKVLFRIWSGDAQGAMSIAFKTLDVVNGLFKIKKFIVET